MGFSPTMSSEEAVENLLQDLIAESGRLIDILPTNHEMLNERQAILFLTKLYAKGLAESAAGTIADTKRCVERMRITVETGEFPTHLLRAANAAVVLPVAKLDLAAMDQEQVVFVHEGRRQQGRLNFCANTNSYQIQYVAAGGFTMEPAIQLTDEMLHDAQILGGVLYLR